MHSENPERFKIEPKVIVDPSLLKEAYPEAYSDSQREYMNNRLAALEESAIASSKQWNGTKERLEAGQVMGAEVSVDDLEEAALKANWYSKLQGSFRADAGKTPEEKIGAMVDFLNAHESKSNPFDRAQTGKIIKELVDLLADPNQHE